MRSVISKAFEDERQYPIEREIAVAKSKKERAFERFIDKTIQAQTPSSAFTICVAAADWADTPFTKAYAAAAAELILNELKARDAEVAYQLEKVFGSDPEVFIAKRLGKRPDLEKSFNPVNDTTSVDTFLSENVAIKCMSCGTEYATRTLKQFGNAMRCKCGAPLSW